MHYEVEPVAEVPCGYGPRLAGRAGGAVRVHWVRGRRHVPSVSREGDGARGNAELIAEGCCLGVPCSLYPFRLSAR